MRREADTPRFAFGIEHEVAFIRHDGCFVDNITTSFADLAAIIARLPLYEADYPQLRIGDAGIRHKRWYIEGFERYDREGNVIACSPKGIEIRTTIHTTIQGAVAELTASFALLREAAAPAGLTPVLASFHPYRTEFVPDPPLSHYEIKYRQQSPEARTSYLHMLTYGPDLNLSCSGLTSAALIDIGRKLTAYSPYIVPFSFSSPFYAGTLWDGLSIRTFKRTGVRPATLVFLARPEDQLVSNPSLTKIARLPAEVGRIEFKACDSCSNFAVYAALLVLLKGLLLDTTLPARATVPDAVRHQLSARHGFSHPEIREGAQAVLYAAEQALLRYNDEDVRLLALLQSMLRERTTPAHALVRLFREMGSIEAALCAAYSQGEILCEPFS